MKSFESRLRSFSPAVLRMVKNLDGLFRHGARVHCAEACVRLFVLRS